MSLRAERHTQLASRAAHLEAEGHQAEAATIRESLSRSPFPHSDAPALSQREVAQGLPDTNQPSLNHIGETPNHRA